MAKNNKTQVLNESDITRRMCQKIRQLNEYFETADNTINNTNETSDTIAIPVNDPYFVELKTNLQKFVGAVKTDDKSLVVYPSDSDVVFNGEITGMNNLKFQFRYNDQSGGLYIWGDSVLLSKDTADKLGKLVVLKDQWKSYWDEKLGDYQKQDNN